jgi:putative transposase
MDESHLYQAIRYVERNPVRGYMVNRPLEYIWSSAKWHIGLTDRPNIYLRSTAIVSLDEWKEYLLEGDQEFKKDFRIKTRKGLAAGNPEFIAEVERKTEHVLHSLKVGRKLKK